MHVERTLYRLWPLGWILITVSALYCAPKGMRRLFPEVEA